MTDNIEAGDNLTENKDILPEKPIREKVEDLPEEKQKEWEARKDDYKEAPAPETKREGGPEILELETLIADFEAEISVEELMQIIEMKEALESPLRKKAKDALIPILKRWQILKKETDISEEKLAELWDRYKRFSNAVGFINSGKVRHE